MRKTPSCRFVATVITLFPFMTGHAEPIQITIEGTPIIQLTEPIQAQAAGVSGNWQYRMYPDQSGPAAALECEPQASSFVEEVHRAGAQRWELVNFVNVAPEDGGETCLFAIFKRPAE